MRANLHPVVGTDCCGRRMMSEASSEPDVRRKALALILMAVLYVPVTAHLGWIGWGLSERWPWIQSFGFFILILILVLFPLQFILGRSRWFRGMVGQGRFGKEVLELLVYYIPLAVVLSLQGLDHAEAIGENQARYLSALSLILPFVLLIHTAVAYGAHRVAARRRARRERRSSGSS